MPIGNLMCRDEDDDYGRDMMKLEAKACAITPPKDDFFGKLAKEETKSSSSLFDIL